ncbi:hypothetical protein PC9H_002154 [Pleurotus ostreatus]|uniref:PH domain-containing protein n=1 Tax=Pleurotus ostreatus TaxID=5322 RepID=A0A8H6ZI63_PLEOS|nr:uncharacterized protein PC9H_002154 [Pleurotus ostreatus]KAF7419563.1 hypothetical protein PC9H_002154 [Pleurotus ostreatus]
MTNAEPLQQVKLLAALRSGDPALIHPFLSEISKDSKDTSLATSDALNTGAAALHLAIRCASSETVNLLLAHRAIDPNGVHPPGSGTTPLHLAAATGRADVVRLLLEQEGIDDTKLDAHGRNCRDLAKGKDTAKAIDDSRAFLNASFRSLLRSYILSPLPDPTASPIPRTTSTSSTPQTSNSRPIPNTQLIALLSSPRARHPLLNVNYIDDASGFSLLHAAAARHDLRMIESAVRSGADVFVRDARGRGVEEEWKAEGDRIKVFLRQCDSSGLTTIHAQATHGLAEPPSLKGYLNKYTNVAKGYNTRWFVLRDGILSYYRHQDDETIASRGSISMKTATLKISPGDARSKLRFEVHSTPSAASHSATPAQRWYMKASHPVEAARWVQALGRSIDWWRAREREEAGIMANLDHSRVSVLANEDARSRKSGDSEWSKSSILRKNLKPGHALGPKGSESDNSYIEGGIGSGHGLGSSSLLSSASNFGGRTMSASSVDVSMRHRDKHGRLLQPGDETDAGESYRSQNDEASSFHRPDDYDDDSASHEHGDESNADDSASGDSGTRGPPHSQTFGLHANSLTAQMEILLAALGKAISDNPTASTSTKSLLSNTHQSLTTLQSLQTEYITMVQAREEWYVRQLRNERKRQSVWEESLKVVVQEGEVLEQELRRRARGRGGGKDSRMLEFGMGQGGTVKAGAMKLRASRIFESMGDGPSLKPGDTVKDKQPLVDTAAAAAPVTQPEQPSQAQSSQALTELPTERKPSLQSPRASSSSIPRKILSRNVSGGTLNALKSSGDAEDEGAVDTDEEDEFFDAIESNTLPNLTIPEPLASPSHTQDSILGGPSTEKADIESFDAVAKKLGLNLDVAQYASYTQLRTRLALDADNRPSTSLWSVLKHSIGKDLTRISFPVFFNEPTSMLQRMAEDMEFSECLDVAAKETDPHKRLAFVAAFAMSNYSSTIGRIAKPFNPMLSETFEYVRLDKEYRYMSEQVSHHPPMSACWAESPNWHYFGEVDAQNKFMGKSFEIRPTGIAHAELLLPEELAPHYPKGKGPVGEGKVIEHYTWKKVTTNVSGFILGSPTIDHYGDMIVTNHRTGDQCILTFKPRGWRGKDAYEISGLVRDSSGNVTYEIAGRWNSQLIARRVGTGSGLLHPDTSVIDPLSPSIQPEYILLWRNSEKPTAPFNLTPFAITLNDCPDSLRSIICPTDCRMRPDQRAFEVGLYERANDLKNAQEEKQRATRRAREEGRLPPHRPRWFSAETDGDTGERVWTPSKIGDSLEYWIEREKIWRENGKISWKDVDPIFTEAEL